MCANKLDDEINENVEKIKLEFEETVVIQVTVLCCRNVHVGYFRDTVDTPDPQVYVKCNVAEGIKKQKTTVLGDTNSGEWNQIFCFVLPNSFHPSLENQQPCVLEFLLYDEDSFRPDDFLGTKKIDVRSIQFGTPKKITLVFGSHGEVDVEVEKQLRKQPDFRFSLALSDEELEFRQGRKAKVLKAMQENLDFTDLPTNINEVPNISIIGSGGGYRAAISYAGAVEALMEEGIVDMTTNMYGLSGGGWYLTCLYAYKALDSYEKLREFHSHLKKAMQNDIWKRALDVPFFLKYKQTVNWKKILRLPLSLVDLFGYAIGLALLGEEKIQTTLSEVQSYIEDGNVPFPLFTALHVRNSIPANEFHAHLEMNPYEISLPNYGINMEPRQYNDEWYKGCVTRNTCEVPLHYLQGVTGSAFAIQFKQLLLGRNSETSLEFDDEIEKFRLAINKLQTKMKSMSTSEPTNDDDTSDEEEEEPLIGKKVDKTSENEEHDKGIKVVEKSKENNTGAYLESISKTKLFSERGLLLKRSGEILNFTRGFDKVKQYMLNPYTEANAGEAKINTSKKVSHFVDSAILCNVPTCSALRPIRNCNVLIVLDCKFYKSDDSIDYFSLLNTERLAKSNGLKFPKINKKKLEKTLSKEMHIFEDTHDLECPIVLWFTLASESFRNVENYVRQKPDATEKIDNVPKHERFNDVYVYGNPVYKTFNGKYTPLAFDRCRELMKFNIKSNIKEIKAAIARSITRRKEVIKMKHSS